MANGAEVAARRPIIYSVDIFLRRLAGLPLVTPAARPECRHVYYVYTIRTPRREELIEFLAERGIGSWPMYPLEVPYQPAYRHLGHTPGDFPAADGQVSEILCLPMYPELTEDEVRKVVGAVREFFT